ncbi:hypothetical protein DUNSADRAFT_727 [Dunaliella salina]|uniref:COG4 transport protein middle alpha-helical bundle domain-containing protein n=1 Tax=Dunaliella salina TaxID=3046 RepID=A0ABQ7GXV6_DUNSA|nr:hypothetical protein DUNSADRAFT_727 [Dunaliella salina]|eukprot:KAF5839443.1 hypothetical protein DUNSADRAFT_727 [Dunaliella salina]
MTLSTHSQSVCSCSLLLSMTLQLIPGSLTSSMVDDVFFIFRKCALRALTTSSVQVRSFAYTAIRPPSACECFEGQRKYVNVDKLAEQAIACRLSPLPGPPSQCSSGVLNRTSLEGSKPPKPENASERTEEER